MTSYKIRAAIVSPVRIGASRVWCPEPTARAGPALSSYQLLPVSPSTASEFPYCFFKVFRALDNKTEQTCNIYEHIFRMRERERERERERRQRQLLQNSIGAIEWRQLTHADCVDNKIILPTQNPKVFQSPVESLGTHENYLPVKRACISEFAYNLGLSNDTYFHTCNITSAIFFERFRRGLWRCRRGTRIPVYNGRPVGYRSGHLALGGYYRAVAASSEPRRDLGFDPLSRMDMHRLGSRVHLGVHRPVAAVSVHSRRESPNDDRGLIASPTV